MTRDSQWAVRPGGVGWGAGQGLFSLSVTFKAVVTES